MPPRKATTTKTPSAKRPAAKATIAKALAALAEVTGDAKARPATTKQLDAIGTGKGSHMARIAQVRGDVVLLSRPAALFRLR